MLKAAIFDMDGVIVDTVPTHFKAWKQMFSGYGKEFSFEDYKKKVDGIPRADGARAILGSFNQEELEKAAALKQKLFLEYLEKEPVKKYDSSVKFINELKKAGFKIGLISASKNARLVLKKAGVIELFDQIVDGHQITKGKPDPEVFLKAAEKLKVKPSECIAFEDAVLGVQAIKAARMICIGVDRYGKPERLSQADLVVSDLSELSLNKLEAFARE